MSPDRAVAIEKNRLRAALVTPAAHRIRHGGSRNPACSSARADSREACTPAPHRWLRTVCAMRARRGPAFVGRSKEGDGLQAERGTG